MAAGILAASRALPRSVTAGSRCTAAAGACPVGGAHPGLTPGIAAARPGAARLAGAADGADGVRGDTEFFVEVRRVGIGFGWIRAVKLERVVDHRPALQFIPVDQCHGDTGLAGPAGAADAVHVGLLVLGNLVVDHVRDVVDVDAASGDVGGDQHVDLTGAERLERLLAGDLAEVAVHGADLEAAFGEFVGHLLGGALGAAEDHRRAAAFGLQDAADHLHLVQRVGAVDELLGAVVGGRTLHALGADVGGLGHERPGEGDDRVRHGRREQHRLALGGNLAQDPFDIGQEAQIQHLVRLIEHQHRQPAESQVALLGEVEQSARGADDDVGTGLQRLDLRLVGPAAIDGDDAELASAISAEVLGRAGQVVVDLNAQLTGGYDDQRARGPV